MSSAALSVLRKSVTVYYWPSGLAGGRGVGHISVLLPNGAYVSHVPDMTGTRTRVGTRPTIPGSSMKNIPICQCPSVRHRTLADDENKFGKFWKSLTLPEKFFHANVMQESAKGFLLATPTHEPPLHGPLRYYQLADSEEGAGDRSQCATTTAKVVSSGVTLEFQEIIKSILEKFTPDSLWKTLNDIVERANK